MNLDELLRSPWFYKSPGPLSLTYYAVLILLGARVLLKRVEYKKWRYVMAMTDSFFLVGFIVLSGDFLWMLTCALRFFSFYPNNVVMVVSCLGRDAVGMVFSYFLVGDRIKQKTISFKRSTLAAYFLLICFLVVDFLVAKDPTFTDWTYAIRQGCSTGKILTALLVSYGLGKAFTAFLIWTWWKE